MDKATTTNASRVEVAVSVPGRIPLDLRLTLTGSPKTLEELIFALAQASRYDEIEVAGGSCCWTFSRDGAPAIHLLIDNGTPKKTE